MKCLSKNKSLRGYSPIESENFASLVGDRKPNDLVEKYRVGPLSPPSDIEERYKWHYYPNEFPLDIPSFEECMRRYYREMEALAKRLVAIFEEVKYMNIIKIVNYSD